MLTTLQEKLGEAHALAIAATTVTEKVEATVVDAALRHELRAMREDARETRARCLDAESGFGEETAQDILAHANSTSEKAMDLAGSWFKAGTGALAAWQFLAMGEAAEVAAWSALERLAARAGDQAVHELAAWALPIQRRHLQTALDGAVALASAVDPAAPRFG
jgi:hypothetical protein